MSDPISLLLISTMSIAAASSRKKRKGNRTSSKNVKKVAKKYAENYREVDVLKSLAVDEHMLDDDNYILSDEEMGNFEIIKEVISLDADEEEIDKKSTISESSEDLSVKCENFLEAVYINPTEEDELPINKIAVEQTVIPVMQDAYNKYNYLDEESLAITLVEKAINELIPICEWKFNEIEHEFVFGNNKQIESEIGKEVIYGLMQISLKIIQENVEKSQLEKAKD